MREPMVRRDGRARRDDRGRRRSTPRPRGLRNVIDVHGADSVAVIGGGARHQRGRLRVGALRQGRDRHRPRRRAARRRLAGRRRARAPARARSPTSTAPPRSSCSAPDLKEELPVLSLRVRRAAEELGVPLDRDRRVPHGLTRYASAVGQPPPRGAGERRGRGARAAITAAQRRAATVRSSSCSGGRRSPSEPTPRCMRPRCWPTLPERALPRRRCGGATCTARSTSASPPGFLPGRVTLDAGREHFSSARGARCPRRRGLDAAGILARRGRRPDQRARAPRRRSPGRLPGPRAGAARRSTTSTS